MRNECVYEKTCVADRHPRLKRLCRSQKDTVGAVPILIWC